MPNPRLGTVTIDVRGAVDAAKGGQVEFRAEKAGIVHAGIGKASFEDGQAAGERQGVRGRDQAGQADRRQGHLREEGADSSTMGMGIKVDVPTLVG